MKYYTDYFGQLKKRFKEEFNLDIDDKGLDVDILTNIVKDLIPHVARKMGKKEDDLKKCLTKLDLIKEPVINGYVNTEDNWKTFQIYISHGLMMFIYKMTKLFLCRMSVRNDHRIVDEARISDEEMLSAAKRLIQAFWSGTLLQTPIFPIIDLSKSQIELSVYLVHYAESFGIAHEFGHVLIESYPEKVQKELYIASAAIERRNKAFLDSLALNKENKVKALKSWPKEFAADLLGLKLCLEQSDDTIFRMVILASAELVFVSMLMLEKFYKKSTGQNYWLYIYEHEHKMKHPPTELRLEFLYSFVDPLYPDSRVSNLGEIFKQFSDYILSKI